MVSPARTFWPGLTFIFIVSCHVTITSTCEPIRIIPKIWPFSTMVPSCTYESIPLTRPPAICTTQQEIGWFLKTPLILVTVRSLWIMCGLFLINGQMFHKGTPVHGEHMIIPGVGGLVLDEFHHA